MHKILIIILVLSCITQLEAGTFRNGDLKSQVSSDDFWEGVDKDGNLRVMKEGLAIMIEGSSTSGRDFGASPAWGDVTGDGKNDLVVGDGRGFIWIFETTSNKGFPPKFTQGKFAHSFMGSALNIDLADMNQDGALDVLCGTSSGAIVIVRNRGGGNFIEKEYYPRFNTFSIHDMRRRKPVDLKDCFPLVMKGTEPLCFGNFTAPRLIDWNSDGKNDLICGEGSYSANSVYLWLNGGENSNPNFTSSQQHWLAYGNGREHLSPTYGDIDGDGDLDLIVGDRLGELTLYENTGKVIDKTVPFLIEAKEPVQVGSTSKPVGELVRPCLADVDGDGDLDLILGNSKGNIHISCNTGTKSAPVFSSAILLKGKNIYNPYKHAQGWSLHCRNRGNSGAYYEMKKETDDETAITRTYAHIAFRDGYFGQPTTFETDADVEFDTAYTVSFDFRGGGLEMTMGIGQHGQRIADGDKVNYTETSNINYAVKPNSSWQKFSKTFTIPNRAKKALRKSDEKADTWIYFYFNTGTPAAYFDVANIKIEKRQ